MTLILAVAAILTLCLILGLVAMLGAKRTQDAGSAGKPWSSPPTSCGENWYSHTYADRTATDWAYDAEQDADSADLRRKATR